MKSILSAFLIAVLLVFSNNAQAQNAYEKGDKLLNVGLSLGGYNYGYGSSRYGGFVPINASLEIGVHENISIGPYFSYASFGYRTAAYDFKNKRTFTAENRYSNTNIGVRGSFHYLKYVNEIFEISIDETKWDFYLTAGAGLIFSRNNFDNNSYTVDFNGNYILIEDETITSFDAHLVGGFKYMFTPKFGAYAELGRGPLGYTTLGLNVKF